MNFAIHVVFILSIGVLAYRFFYVFFDVLEAKENLKYKVKYLNYLLDKSDNPYSIDLSTALESFEGNGDTLVFGRSDFDTRYMDFPEYKKLFDYDQSIEKFMRKRKVTFILLGATGFLYVFLLVYFD